MVGRTRVKKVWSCVEVVERVDIVDAAGSRRVGSRHGKQRQDTSLVRGSCDLHQESLLLNHFNRGRRLEQQDIVGMFSESICAVCAQFASSWSSWLGRGPNCSNTPSSSVAT